MYIKIIMSVVVLACLVFMARYFIISPKTILPTDTTATSFPSITSTSSARVPETFLSKSGQVLSDQPFIEYRKTQEIQPGFFESTNESDVFGLYYLQSGGNLTVTLYGENTAKARLSAEEYLKDVLPYSEAELCSIDAIVITNEYENPRYAGQNLGFSFCPGSVVLP